MLIDPEVHAEVERVDGWRGRPGRYRPQKKFDGGIGAFDAGKRVAALRINAGPSNPQHGDVRTGHAKVHVIHWDGAGNLINAGRFL